MKQIFTLIIFQLINTWNFLFSQDLIEAVKHYSQDIHFEYEAELIRKGKIATMEEREFNYSFDTLDKGRILQKYLFNKEGQPIEIIGRKNYGSDSVIIRFQYNSLNQLVKKTIIKPAETYPHQYREEEVFVWEYTGNALTKTFHFMTPRGDYMYSSYDRLVLFSSDSIAYNDTDSSVTFFTNHREHYKGGTVEFFNPSFNRPYTTVMKFHDNYKPKSRSLELDSLRRFDQYNYCGYDYTPPAWELKGILQLHSCLPPRFAAVFNSIEKISYRVDSIEITLNKSRDFLIHTTTIVNDNFITIDLKEQKMLIQTTSQHQQIFQDRNEIISARVKEFYDLALKLLYSEYYTERYVDRGEIPVDSADAVFAFTFPKATSVSSTFETKRYEYYENGLLKSETTFSDRGVILHIVEYNLTYFE